MNRKINACLTHIKNNDRRQRIKIHFDTSSQTHRASFRSTLRITSRAVCLSATLWHKACCEQKGFDPVLLQLTKIKQLSRKYSGFLLAGTFLLDPTASQLYQPPRSRETPSRTINLESQSQYALRQSWYYPRTLKQNMHFPCMLQIGLLPKITYQGDARTSATGRETRPPPVWPQFIVRFV